MTKTNLSQNHSNQTNFLIFYYKNHDDKVKRGLPCEKRKVT